MLQEKQCDSDWTSMGPSVWHLLEANCSIIWVPGYHNLLPYRHV
uniref:Uncharacterized protein n=1 Tax=Arundo donax TaxID=35708 RepID=A0A0A8Y1G5_ARUDO